MARCHNVLVIAFAALAAGACSSNPAPVDNRPDAPSSLCANSTDCVAGNWCNPNPVDSNPADTLCEPRGATIYSFTGDIYPTIAAMCVGCHVANVPDSQGGNISVFVGGPAVAFASLIAGGTTCDSTPHKICVDEPKNSTAVVRLLTHLDASNNPNSKLIPTGYADPWMQKLLHWIAAGASYDGVLPDARVVDAPTMPPTDARPPADAPIAPDAPRPIDAPPTIDAPPPVDAPPPDAFVPPDGPVDTTPPVGGDLNSATVDGCGVVTFDIAPATDNVTPPNQIRFQVCWSTSSTGCANNFQAMATYSASGTQTFDLSADEGTTFFFSSRAVDRRGNHNDPTVTRSATIPTPLAWSGGGVGVTKVGAPGTYSVSWPSVSTTCASKPLSVSATCSSSGGCSCTVAGDQQTATCTAASCNAISVTVTASAGLATQMRSGSFVTHFADVSFIFDTMYAVGHSPCRDCHGASFVPSFTTGMINHNERNDLGQTSNCPTYNYVQPTRPDLSLIYGVAVFNEFFCTGDAHTYNGPIGGDATILNCWITDGANP